MIRCTCGAELFSIESICSACLPPKPPRALFVEDLRIKLANLEEELLDWKETAELTNTENVELRAERDRLKAALEAFVKHFGPLQDNAMLHENVRNCYRLARKALGDAS